mmetsp:Transcript_24072/g.63477  ORF Transcript_24072/g.63477 Transcript_24072/m.63477 type:complete len:1013 (-) Transcript_24072:214-3252(-)
MIGFSHAQSAASVKRPPRERRREASPTRGALHDALQGSWWSSVDPEGKKSDEEDPTTTLAEELQKGDGRIGDLLQVLADQLPPEAEACLELVARLRCTGDFAAQHLTTEAAGIVRQHLASHQETGAKHRVRLRSGNRQGVVKTRETSCSAEGQEGASQQARPALALVCACGSIYMSDATFCRKCGAPREEATHAGSPRPPDQNGGFEPGNLEAADFVSKAQQVSKGTRLRRAATAKVSRLTNGLPFFPDRSHGNLRQRCFVLFDDSSASVCGKLIAVVLISTISVSTVAFTMESMPDFRETPDECAALKAAGLPLTVEACEPKALALFDVLEFVCIVIFTIDYVLRVATVHSVAPDVTRTRMSTRMANWDDPEVMHPPRNRTCAEGLRRTFNYARQPLAVVDLLAVLPFYVDLVTTAFGHPEGVLGPAAGLLRLMRVLRLLKLARGHKGIAMYAEVLAMSGEPLAILMFFNYIIVVLFGTLMYYAEGTTFSVAPEWTAPSMLMRADGTNFTKAARHPTGVHVHYDAFSTEIITPFTSIPRALWWVCVTMTTVGYGDFVPVTPIGKMIGITCFYIGVVFLALPISVLGRNFDIVYNRMLVQQKLDEANAPKPPLRRSKRRKAPAPARLASGSLEVRLLPQNCAGLRQHVFMVMEDSSASRLGKWASILMLLAILASTVSFILESMPAFRETPGTCKPPHVLTVIDCRPVPLPVFYSLELLCIVVFTIEYVGRMGTVHACTAEMFGFGSADPRKTGWRLTLSYFRQPINLIDLFAVAPFYVEKAGLIEGGGTGVLRVLRLIRVFRVMKMPKLRSCAEMFIDVALDAAPALAILLFMTTLTCVFFASCMYFAEGTQYSVDLYPEDRSLAQRPTGLYIRPRKEGYGIEESPFRSIPGTFWWFFTTATTVGYGDDYPTTTPGRFVAVLVFCAGIILLAMPITIVGGSFTKFYSTWVQDFGEDGSQDGSQDGSGFSSSELGGSQGGSMRSLCLDPEQCSPLGEVPPPHNPDIAKVAWS